MLRPPSSPRFRRLGAAKASTAGAVGLTDRLTGSPSTQTRPAGVGSGSRRCTAQSSGVSSKPKRCPSLSQARRTPAGRAAPRSASSHAYSRRRRKLALGLEAPLGVFLDVRRAREIGFPRRVQARDPAPRTGVRGRVSIEQISVKQISTQDPRQLERKNPDARKPHARVIVQVVGLLQLSCPRVKALDARAPFNRFGIAAGKDRVLVQQRRTERDDVGAVAAPDFRAVFQPTLEVRLRQKTSCTNFSDAAKPWRESAALQHIGLQDQPMPNPRRKARYLVVRSRDQSRSSVAGRRTSLPSGKESLEASLCAEAWVAAVGDGERVSWGAPLGG